MANIQYYDVILKPVVTEKKYERYEREKIYFPGSSGSKQIYDQRSC